MAGNVKVPVGADVPQPLGDDGALAAAGSPDALPGESDGQTRVSESPRSIFGKDILYFVALTVQLTVSFLLTPLQARVLHAGGYGQLSLAIAITQVLSVIVCLGLLTAAQRTYHRPGGVRLARALLGLVLLSALACSVGLSFTARSWAPVIDHVPHGTTIMGEVAVWASMTGVTSFCMAILRSAQRLRLYWALAVLQGLVAPMLAVMMAVTHRGSVSDYLDGLLIGQFVAMGLGMAALRPRVPRFVDLPAIGQSLRFGLLLIPQQVSGVILSMGDRIVIQHTLGSVANGRYSAAYSVGSIGVVGATMLSSVWLPRVFSLRAGAEEAGVLGVLRTYVEIMASVVTVGLCIGAPLLMDIWLPPSFDAEGLRMVTSMITISMLPYVWFLSEMWIMLRRAQSGALAAITVTAAVANLILNIIMLPRLGIDGAGIATFVSYALLAITARRMAGRRRVYSTRRLRLWVTAVAAVSLSVASAFMPAVGIWAVERALGVTSCLAALGFLIWRARSALGSALPEGVVS